MKCLRFFLELLPLTIIFIDVEIPNWVGPSKCVIIQDRGGSSCHLNGHVDQGPL
jgi:hypothetical protein